MALLSCALSCSWCMCSAFRDRRFDPIAAHEIPKLKCSVSLLVQYEDGEHHLDWEVGRMV